MGCRDVEDSELDTARLDLDRIEDKLHTETGRRHGSNLKLELSLFSHDSQPCWLGSTQYSKTVSVVGKRVSISLMKASNLH